MSGIRSYHWKVLLCLKESANSDKVNELTVLKHITEAGIPAFFFFLIKRAPSDSMEDQKRSRNKKTPLTYFQLTLQRAKNNVEIKIIDMMHDQVLDHFFWESIKSSLYWINWLEKHMDFCTLEKATWLLWKEIKIQFELFEVKTHVDKKNWPI